MGQTLLINISLRNVLKLYNAVLSFTGDQDGRTWGTLKIQWWDLLYPMYRLAFCLLYPKYHLLGPLSPGFSSKAKSHRHPQYTPSTGNNLDTGSKKTDD